MPLMEYIIDQRVGHCHVMAQNHSPIVGELILLHLTHGGGDLVDCVPFQGLILIRFKGVYHA